MMGCYINIQLHHIGYIVEKTTFSCVIISVMPVLCVHWEEFKFSTLCF